MQRTAAGIDHHRHGYRRPRVGKSKLIHRVHAHAAPAAAGLAPATYLTFPSPLAERQAFDSIGGDRILALLSLAMIEAELAVAGDFSGNLKLFVMDTLRRWWKSLGASAERMMDLHLAIRSQAVGDFGRPPEDASPTGRLFFVIEVHRHYFVEIGPAVEALRRIDNRLPSMFWHCFAGALRRFMHVMDYLSAVEDEIWVVEDWDEWEGDQEEGAQPKQLRPSKTIPPCLKKKPPESIATVKRVVTELRLDRSSWAGRMMYGPLDLAELAARGDDGIAAAHTEDPTSFWDAHPLPGLVAVLTEGDSLQHHFDRQLDAHYNAGVPTLPAVAWPFDGATAAGVRAIYEKLELFCEVMHDALALLRLLEKPPAPEPRRRRRGAPRTLAHALGIVTEAVEADSDAAAVVAAAMGEPVAVEG